MVQVTPQHPQVTPEQIQLWEADPVTKAYLKCLAWTREDVREDASDATIIDSACADLTHARIHINMGQQQGLVSAIDYGKLLSEFNMILKEEKTDGSN